MLTAIKVPGSSTSPIIANKALRWKDLEITSLTNLEKFFSQENVDLRIAQLTSELLTLPTNQIPSKDAALRLCERIRPLSVTQHHKDRFFSSLERAGVFKRDECVDLYSKQSYRDVSLEDLLKLENSDDYILTITQKCRQNFTICIPLSGALKTKLLFLLCKEVKAGDESLYQSICALIANGADLSILDENQIGPLEHFIAAGGNIATLLSDIDFSSFRQINLYAYLSTPEEMYETDKTSQFLLALCFPVTRQKFLYANSLDFLIGSRIVALAQFVNREWKYHQFDWPTHKQMLMRLTNSQIKDFLENLSKPVRKALCTSFIAEDQHVTIELAVKSITTAAPFLNEIDSEIIHKFHFLTDDQKAALGSTNTNEFSKSEALANLSSAYKILEKKFLFTEDQGTGNDVHLIKEILSSQIPKASTLSTQSHNEIMIAQQRTTILSKAKYEAARVCVEQLYNPNKIPIHELDIDWDDLVQRIFQDKTMSSNLMETYIARYFETNMIVSIDHLIADLKGAHIIKDSFLDDARITFP